jgi:hypothetical protein
MDVRGASRIAVTAFLMAALSLLSSGQSRPATYDPAAGKAAKPQEGFVDFTLKRINPADHDYGQCLDVGRALLLDESVRKGYFWSNLVALSLLGCLFLIIVFQYRLQARRDWNVARIVGQYEQALARSHAQLEQVTKSNHGLNNALAAIKESGLRPTSQSRESSHRVSSIVVEGRASKPQNTAVSPSRVASRKPAAEESSGISMPQMAPIKADGDIIVRLNSLEQQLAYAQEDNKRLRQRLAEGDRRIELEQQKNHKRKSV